MPPKRRRVSDDVSTEAVVEGDMVVEDVPCSPARKKMRRQLSKPVASRRNTKDQPCDMNIDAAVPAPSVSCQFEDLTFVIHAAEQFVKSELAGNDSSHDYFHICRVRSVADTLAKKEGLTESQRQIISLSAILHDVGDWKYADKGSKAQGKAVESFLKTQAVSRRTTSHYQQRWLQGGAPGIKFKPDVHGSKDRPGC